MPRRCVRGLAADVVFFDHRVLKSGEGGPAQHAGEDLLLRSKMSKRKDFEALLVMQVVRYLLAQGYAQDDVVVLTPYLGQLRQIKEALHGAEVDSQIRRRDAAELAVAQRGGEGAEDGEALGDGEEAEGGDVVGGG
jgi:hypothetical protein